MSPLPTGHLHRQPGVHRGAVSALAQPHDRRESWCRVCVGGGCDAARSASREYRHRFCEGWRSRWAWRKARLVRGRAEELSCERTWKGRWRTRGSFTKVQCLACMQANGGLVLQQGPRPRPSPDLTSHHTPLTLPLSLSLTPEQAIMSNVKKNNPVAITVRCGVGRRVVVCARVVLAWRPGCLAAWWCLVVRCTGFGPVGLSVELNPKTPPPSTAQLADPPPSSTS